MNTGGEKSINTPSEEGSAEVQQEQLLDTANRGETGSAKNDGKLSKEIQGNAQDGKMTITVKTKSEDGGSRDIAESSTGTDAFSRYSNTNVRMMHLLSLHDGGDNNEDNTVWQVLTGYQGRRRVREGGANPDDRATRKTRLSTELHGNAFLGDMF